MWLPKVKQKASRGGGSQTGRLEALRSAPSTGIPVGTQIVPALAQASGHRCDNRPHGPGCEGVRPGGGEGLEQGFEE